ncbi:MAG: ankyrin repeat domain-containing protein, partial [Phycisphaerales bacterium]
MRRLNISISILFLLILSSGIPAFAQIDERISNLLPASAQLEMAENEESAAPASDYVPRLNELGMAGRPESDNAAPYYLRATELFVEMPNELRHVNWTWPDELSADQQDLLQQWIQNNNEALEQLRLGSQKKYCWFNYTGRTLNDAQMPYLTGLRNSTKALRARAMQQAQTGDINSAVDDVISLYKVGAHITNGPKIIIEKLLGMSIKTLSVKSALHILDKSMADADVTKNMQDRFEQAIREYDEPFDVRHEKMSLQEQVEIMPQRRSYRRYLQSTLEYYDALVLKTPWQLHNEPTQSNSENNPLIEASEASGFARAIENSYRNKADEQALLTTLALLRYYTINGECPAELSELVSAGYIRELPSDPYSDRPLVYKRRDDSFTFYSFAADFDDDNGAYSRWGREEDGGGDQVFWPLQAASVTAERITPRRTLTGQALREANESLRQAVVMGNADQVRSLLSEGADINARDRIGGTPLHTAVQNRNLELIELLLDEGADIDARNNSGQTPLHLAVNYSRQNIAELLIEKGADINITTNRRENALTMARRRRNSEMEQFLLQHGAEEPAPPDTDIYGSRGQRQGQNLYPDFANGRITQPGTRPGGRAARQSTAQVDILANPDEIRTRIRSFEGLENELNEIAGKSRTEVRQWQQTRIDNRTSLARSVQRQYEGELGLIRKVAVDENAQMTTQTVDNVLSAVQEQFRGISRGLQAQRREQRQTQTQTNTRTGGRTRTSGRGSRGQASQRGQTNA